MISKSESGSVRSIWSGLDRQTTIILAVAIASLWIARFGQDLASPSWTRLTELNWWAGTQFVAYLVIPLAVAAALGIRPRDLGWTWKGIASHWKIYLGLFAVAVPFVIVASSTQQFQDQYPLYEVQRGQTKVWSELVRWWPFYLAQFVAIESFFRGYLVLGLARRFGSSAILISVVPYMMIHFVKPPAEALASVIGGIVLGALALRTGSILWGIALHVAIAALMDIMALGHKGFIW